MAYSKTQSPGDFKFSIPWIQIPDEHVRNAAWNSRKNLEADVTAEDGQIEGQFADSKYSVQPTIGENICANNLGKSL